MTDTAPILYVGVPGTGGSHRPDDWDNMESNLSHFLEQHGIYNIAGNAISAYHWSTDIDMAGGHDDWKAAGWALFYYVVPQLRPTVAIPPEKTNIICHSHGL